MLTSLFFRGIVAGMIIAVPVGPVGVYCVRRTIVDGRLAGFLAGLGAATADAIYGIIAGFGLSFISDWLIGYQGWLRGLGGIFLLYVGVAAFRAKPKIEKRSERDPERLFAGFISTFALTITNPITILAFLAIFSGLGLGGNGAGMGGTGMLVLGVWIGSLLWWAGLALTAGIFRKSFDERHLGWINRGSGVILFLSGIGLLGSLAYSQFR